MINDGQGLYYNEYYKVIFLTGLLGIQTNRRVGVNLCIGIHFLEGA